MKKLVMFAGLFLLAACGTDMKSLVGTYVVEKGMLNGVEQELTAGVGSQIVITETEIRMFRPGTVQAEWIYKLEGNTFKDEDGRKFTIQAEGEDRVSIEGTTEDGQLRKFIFRRVSEQGTFDFGQDD